MYTKYSIFGIHRLVAIEKNVLAELAWVGDSREVLRGFPASVRADLGFALDRLQRGQIPPIARRLSSVGPGVWELKESDERTWYRVVYLTKIDNRIYVLHSFEKKGRKTDKRDLEKAKERLKAVQAFLDEEKKNEKRKKI